MTGDPHLASSGSPLDEDALLIDAMRRLETGDSTGFRRLLDDHPDRAAALQARVRALQDVGFFAGAVLARRFGTFAIERKLGQGGMGVVYLARGDGDSGPCALKLVRPELLDSVSARQRFAREVAAARALQHPGIVRILADGVDGEVPWFAMQHVDGPSLAELIQSARREGPAAVARRWLPAFGGNAETPPRGAWTALVLRVMVQVLDAVAHAHDCGTAHRDLKPSNVLLDPAGQAVLIDFGLALSAGATTITVTGDTLGSLPYMAPEVLRGAAADHRTDLWSLGATLYHALTLQLPFPSANAEALRAAILLREPAPLRDLDPTLPLALEAVWRRAMAPEPKLRYASARAFAADLRAVLHGERPAARMPGPWRRLVRWSRRQPMHALALGGGLLFAVALPTTVLVVQARELWAAQRLSDLQSISELEQRDAELWPARPERVAAPDGFDAWLAAADELLARLPAHRADLAAVRTRGQHLDRAATLADNPRAQELQHEIDYTDSNLRVATTTKPAGWEDWRDQLEAHRAPLVLQLDEVEAWRFADAADARLHRNLARLALGGDRLAALRQRIADRRQAAFALERASLHEPADRWQATVAAIADRTRNPRYCGLTIEPQFGLVPIGQDPDSGLFEFAFLPSGAAPERRDGRIHPQAEDAIVLVLLPGGMARVGADAEPDAPHHDPASGPEDQPSIEVRLDPFFVSKYEVTQAQWYRQRGRLGGTYKVGQHYPACRFAVGWTNPVDFITLEDARSTAQQWGLQVPTGAQWEYAARGGTTTPWWTGPDPRSLDDAENLRDPDTNVVFVVNDPGEGLQPADGHGLHRPVGELRANPFGLHDVLGNVEEWCSDSVRSYAEGLRDGDGRARVLDYGSLRGGSFSARPTSARVSWRKSTGAQSPHAGLRPMRAIEGPWTQDPPR